MEAELMSGSGWHGQPQSHKQLKPQYEDDEFLPSHTQHLPASQNLSLSLLGMIRLEGSHYRDACGRVKSGPSKICLPAPFKCGPYLEKGSLQME